MRANGIALFKAERADRRFTTLRLVDGFAWIVGRILTYRRQRANIAMLRGMSDRELKDIGVYRCDVDRIIRQMSDDAIAGASHARSVL